jgi:hypothetical protein
MHKINVLQKSSHPRLFDFLVAFILLFPFITLGQSQSQTLTPASASPWTVPAGVQTIQAEAWSGGGGSGGIGATVSAGGQGSLSTFSTISITGGGSSQGAANNIPTTGGTAGTASGGDLNSNGVAGTTGTTGQPSYGGDGGASPNGGATQPGAVTGNNAEPVPGVNGNAPGGGAGGAARDGNNANLRRSTGGGGGGGYAKLTALSVQPGETIPFTVGAGGSAGTGDQANGGAGANGQVLITYCIPTISCIISQTRSTDPGLCIYTVNGTEFDPTVGGGCAGTTASWELTGQTTTNGTTTLSGVEFNKGITTVTWTATAADGNFAGCSFTVTVNDNENPTITCAVPEASYGTDAGTCSFTVAGTALDPAGFGDNCPGATVSNNYNNTATLNGAIFNTGTTTVTWTVTDAAGLTASCPYDINVTDDEPPAITLLGNATVNICTGATYTDAGATAADNCDGDLIASIITNNPVNTLLAATYIVTYNVSDAAGNPAGEVSRTVIVHDLPIVSDVSLQFSPDVAGPPWIAADGNFATEFYICLDQVTYGDFYYLDVNQLLASVALEEDFLNPFYLATVNSSTFISWWEAQFGTWPEEYIDIMEPILAGTSPMFYIRYDGVDYSLIDGFMYALNGTETTLQVDADYPPGTYTYNGTIKDIYGCLSDPFDVVITFGNTSTYAFSYDAPANACTFSPVTVPVTFETEALGNCGYDGVIFAFSATGPGNVTFGAWDEPGNYITFTNSGTWGPTGGFNLPASYSATTDWDLEFDAPGSYTINFSLVDALTLEVIAGLTASDVIEAVEDCHVYNASRDLYYLTIQDAIDNAEPGDAIEIPSGTYTENVTTAGAGGLTLIPGNSPGCVTIDGNLTLTENDNISIELAGLVQCTGYDAFIVTGNLAWNGATVDVILGSFNPGIGDAFTIFQNTTLSGFSGPVEIAEGAYRFVLDASGSNLVLTLSSIGYYIDIAIRELECGSFEVVLKPAVDLIDNTLTNVQFTVQYPSQIGLLNLVPLYGFQAGLTMDPTDDYKYITYVAELISDPEHPEYYPNTGWLAGQEYVVLTFNHDQNPGPLTTGDLLIWPGSHFAFEFYAEIAGSDATGIIYENATGVLLTCQTSLSMKVLLQGANTGTGLMRTALNADGRLPVNQPYSVSPWNYPGTETLPDPLPANAVDWVLVELRDSDAASGYVVQGRAAALLYANGSVFTDLLVPLSSQSYIVVYHHNHMPVMSSVPIGPYYAIPYDFTLLENIYGYTHTPNKPAIEVVTLNNPSPVPDEYAWAMITGYVTSDGVLNYTGPDNDRGPILARIIELTGNQSISGVVTGGYWVEDINLNNEIRYTGENNDRAIILTNLGILSGSTNLSAEYFSLVPGEYMPAKDSWTPNGPVSIYIDKSQINIATSYLISNGLIDNIQFTLAWNSGDLKVEGAVKNFVSDFNLMPQGDPVNIGGINHQLFVTVTPVYLPSKWDVNEPVTVMSFEGSDLEGRLWIADNGYTSTHNAMYYVSVWGKDQTGTIKASGTESGNLTAEAGMRLFPNPSAGGNLYIELPFPKNRMMQVEVSHAQGKLLIESYVMFGNGATKVDISGLGPGVYIIRVYNEKELHTSRFIVVR